MSGMFKKIKSTANRKSVETKKSEKQQQLERQKRIEEQNKVAEQNRLRLEEFSRKTKQIETIVKDVYDKSSGLKEIAKALRNPNKTQASCKRTFWDVKTGIENKYGLRFEFVDFGVVQRLTQQGGNYASYLESHNTIMMEKLPQKGNPKEIDWEHMLRELRHEYGYFLLLGRYGSREKIPWVGNMAATHMLDELHD